MLAGVETESGTGARDDGSLAGEVEGFWELDGGGELGFEEDGCGAALVGGHREGL